MKKLSISLILITVFTSTILGQNAPYSLYFLPGWVKKHTVNAAVAADNSYFSLPVVGGTQMSVNSNLGVSKLLYKSNDPSDTRPVTFLHSSVDAAKFLKGLQDLSYLNGGMSVTLLSAGQLTEKNEFFSIDFNVKELVEVTMPKDLFAFLKSGMTNSSNYYSFKNLGIDHVNIVEVALGYSRDIIPDVLRLGVKGKLMSGQSAARINFNKFDLNFNNDVISATAEGELNMTNNLFELPVDKDNNYDLGSMKINTENAYTPSGMGYAMDVGITVKPMPELTIEAAVNDIGKLIWDKQTMQKGVLNGNFSFEGFNGINEDSIANQFDDLKINAINMMDFKKTESKHIYDKLPRTISIAAEYSILNFNKKNELLVGLLYQGQRRRLTNTSNLVGALSYKPFSWLAMTGTCNFISKDMNVLGFALNLSPAGINLFAAVDYLTPQISKLSETKYYPSGIAKVNLAFGGSISLGGYRKKK